MSAQRAERALGVSLAEAPPGSEWIDAQPVSERVGIVFDYTADQWPRYGWRVAVDGQPGERLVSFQDASVRAILQDRDLQAAT